MLKAFSSEKVGPFVLGKTLGKGMTSKVKLAVHEQTGFKVAVKIVKKKYLQKVNTRRQVEREIAILKLIDHPHILKLYDVRETPKHLFLVMEYVTGGELFDYIISKGKLCREEALRFTAQITQGLEHCHQHSICHRDLKPENILLDKNQTVKIGDFGMAKMILRDKRLKTR